MSKPHALRFVLMAVDELSLTDPQPINQQRWADELDITQPTMGKMINDLIEIRFLEEHPPEGKARQFTVRPGYPGVQRLFNRRM